MAGNLSQKERTIIQDQMRHEEVCINKYNEYARRTNNTALRGLFNEFAKDEEQHYQTLNGLLGGSKSQSQGQTGGVSASGGSASLSGMSDEEFIRQAAEQRLQGRTQQHVMPGEEALMQSGWSQQISQQGGQQGSQQSGQQFRQQSSQQFAQPSGQQVGQQSGQQFNQQSGQQSGWAQSGLQGQLQQPSQSRMAQQGQQPQQSQQLQQSSQLQSGQSQQNQQSQQFRSPQSFQEASRELIPMFRAETAQEFAGAGSSADESSIVRDMLMTEQFVSGSYDSAIFDSISQNVRQALQHIQKDEQKHGQRLREYMQSKGQS